MPIQGQPYILQVQLLEDSKVFVTGQIITYSVVRSSDNFIVASGTMTELSNVYVATVTLADLGQHRVFYTTPAGYENGAECLIVTIDINAYLKRILGLSQENYRLTDQVYNVDGCLLSATITTYPTAPDTYAETNPIAVYEITAVYDVDAHLIDYKVVKI